MPSGVVAAASVVGMPSGVVAGASVVGMPSGVGQMHRFQVSRNARDSHELLLR